MTSRSSDESITCDDDGLTIRRYRVPVPTAKRIAYWLNLDWKRRHKRKGIKAAVAGQV